MRPILQLIPLVASAVAAASGSGYPNLLPSVLTTPAHDALAPTHTPALKRTVTAPHKPGWDDTWDDEGIMKPLISSASSAGSVIGGKLGRAKETARAVGDLVGGITRTEGRREQQGQQQEEGYYRTIRETVEWVNPTHQPKHHPDPPTPAPALPTNPALAHPATSPPPLNPEPAHISHLTPHLLRLLSLLTFIIHHPLRFLLSSVLPTLARLLSLLATRALWPALRLPLNPAWSIVSVLFHVVTAPVRWAAGVWDRWGELGVFLGGAVVVGAGMGVAGAGLSGPRVRGWLKVVLGRAEEKVERKVEARWETVAKGRGKVRRPDRGVGAYPTAGGKTDRRSDSLDTIRPSASRHPPAPAPAPAPTSASSTAQTTRPWASSAPSYSLPSVGRAFDPASASASASSSEMGRAGSGGGKAGPARNAASVALAEARRRVEENRRARGRA